jgi:hypothetical protein
MGELFKRNVAVESVEVLRKKTKSIKNVYRRQLTKNEKSPKNGAGDDDVHQHKLFLYLCREGLFTQPVFHK